MHEFSYHRPASLDELWGVVGAAGGAVSLLAGGTDVVPSLKQGTLTPSVLVDVKRLAELDGIVSTADGGLSIGAAVSLHALARSSDVAAFWPILAEAAGTVASYQIRNRGTVGGNLCLDTRCSYFNQSAFWRLEYPDCRKAGGGSCYVVPRGDRCHALSSSDLAPLMVALGARVEVATPAGARVVALDELYVDDGLRATTLDPGEVLTRVLLPAPDGTRVAYRRHADRETVDFPMVSVALTAGPAGPRVVVGHVASRPLRAPRAEALLASYVADKTGAPADVGVAAAEELPLTSSVRGSVSYKRRIVRTLVERSVGDLVDGPADRARGV